jgi:hypothetical protein
MATVFRELPLAISADEAWRMLVVGEHPDRPFRFLPRAHEADGRRIDRALGDVPVEGRVLAVEPGLRRISYTIKGWPVGAELHAATLQVVGRPRRGASLTWSTLIKPDALAAQLASLIDAEFEHARRFFEQLAAARAAE